MTLVTISFLIQGKTLGYESEIAIRLSFPLQSIHIIVHIKDSIILSLNTVIAIRVAEFQSKV